jgi:predicted secreted protein
MATVTGQLGGVRIGSVNVAEVRNFEISFSADTVEDTVMGDTWKSNKAIHKSWTASIECYFDTTNTTGQGVLAVGATVALELYPNNLPPGAPQTTPRFTGNAIVTGRTVKAQHDGIVELSLTVIGVDTLTETP